jgi:hypothetical protein
VKKSLYLHSRFLKKLILKSHTQKKLLPLSNRNQKKKKVLKIRIEKREKNWNFNLVLFFQKSWEREKWNNVFLLPYSPKK